MDFSSFSKDVGEQALKIVKKGGGREHIGVNPLNQDSMAIDVELEEMVANLAKECGFTGCFVSEEGGEKVMGKSPEVIICDPLDGSNNYRRRAAPYCLGVSYAKGSRYQDITHAYIIDLITGDEYSADEEGAYCNGERISTSQQTELANSVIEYDPIRFREVSDRLLPMLCSVRDVRRYGANLMGLCYLAKGAHQAFVDFGNTLSAIHVCGLFIVEKAGGIITNPDANEFNPKLKVEEKLNFVASANEQIHQKIIDLIRNPSRN